MSRTIRVAYSKPLRAPSGLAVEEVPATPGTRAAGWPFRTARFTVPAGVTGEPDQHEVAELWMVRAGEGVVRSGDDIVELRVGDSVFFPPWTPHQATAGPHGPLEVFSLWWRQEER
ncbi:cupin domain-containing protein [Streptomyces ossamyceticus]|uniref:cupin domain-containing protein n=1 Tax=Streptomyces ossamyceticus TaxID=249581 RepID=UPI00099E5162|nr:cupin domain-containing protein [Streptomyces ossamyceticus]